MKARASELGWSEEKFYASNWRVFHWEWVGYTRRAERTVTESVREVVAMLYNVNAKKGRAKNAKRLMPLSIDMIKEFTYEDALEQFERTKKAGWLTN